MQVFQTPRGKKLSTQQASYLQSHEKDVVHHLGQKMPYYHWPGGGQKILLLHGWESSSYRWRSYIKELTKLGFDVYAVDAPAHGRSDGTKFSPPKYAATIKTIVEKEKINTIIAHSVGAYSTIIYTSENDTPISLRNLILMAPTGRLKDFMQQFFDFLKLNSKVRLAFEKNFFETYGRTLDYYDSHRLIQSVKIGGILIHDKDDQTLPYSDSVEIDKHWSTGRFITTEGYGHRLKGTFIRNLILKHLKGTS